MSKPLKFYRCIILIFAFNFALQTVYSQQADSSAEISLPFVIIKVFEQNRLLKDVPASINYIGKSTFQKYGSGSIVSAVNTMPGVKMEERSPGSYKLNIRGSSLRSPFGVRNVKIYYNDIPYTDPGGQSYLNTLGYYNYSSIEIIKGANNSLYGAGTGGAMLIQGLDEKEKSSFFTEYTSGSYHLQNLYASLTAASNKSVSKVGFQHQQNEGYRDHSKLKRVVFSWNGLFRFGKIQSLKTTFLFGDLFYETPGALTKAQFNNNPKAARPATAAFPGAISANAYVHQKMFLAGASYAQLITSNLQNKTTLYGMYTDFRNPNINNYDKSSEPHAGGRTVFKYSRQLGKQMLNIDAGAEVQQGFTTVNIHKNINGNADSLRSTDDINNRQSLLFAQTSLDFKTWIIITGASLNMLRIRFQRFTPATLGKQGRTFNNQISPRFSVLKKFGNINFYTSIAKGFSPPSTDELLPTGGAINIGLNAEHGTNYDVGIKATFFKNLYVDINVFFFSLSNAIVQRRDAGGGNFFINAGSTKQHGIESYFSYPIFLSSEKFKKGILWISHTWHDFHYKEFKQLNADFSGNRLPSSAPHVISSGIDVSMKNGFAASLTYYYSDKISLNDGNTEYANAYHLLGAKADWNNLIKNKFILKISAGIDNLLNATYSLGNDINGFGGRYYNAAPKRNFYLSFAVQILTKNNQ